MDITCFRIGDRVELHPATDAWMSGDRYGVVREITFKYLRVRMDKSDRLLRVNPASVYDVNPRWLGPGVSESAERMNRRAQITR